MPFSSLSNRCLRSQLCSAEADHDLRISAGLEDPAGETSRSAVVLTLRGQDSPGIFHGIVDMVARHGCSLLDTAQVRLEGMLVCTYLIDLKLEDTPTDFVKDCLEFGARIGVQLDFNFLDSGERSVIDNERKIGSVALVSIVGSKPLSPLLLHDMDAVFKKNSCVVIEIEHRTDNKIEYNGQYNKVNFRVHFPIDKGYSLAAIYLELKEVTTKHEFEVTVRWWDAMNRPNLRSLVTFGLSNVLCPCDVLEELLKEAGVFSQEMATSSDGSSSMEEWNPYKEKVKLLKGCSNKAMQRLISRLEFTPGAKMVCRSLKAMGFRLAISSNSGIRPVCEYVKRQLGFDYVICQDLEVDQNSNFTGKYTDETDASFRKADVMQLAAEKEGLDFRNVIFVGHQFQDEMKDDLAKEDARGNAAIHLLDSFGPLIYFKYGLHVDHDLSMVLYLLGFNGSDVYALQQKHAAEYSPHIVSTTHTPIYKHLLRVRISSTTRETGQIAQILKPLLQFDKDVSFVTVRHRSLLYGGISLGMELRCAADVHSVLKELLYTCLSENFQAEYEDLDSNTKRILNPSPSCVVSKLTNQYRHVVTIVQKPRIQPAMLSAFLQKILDVHGNILKIERLSARDHYAIQLLIELPADCLDSDLRAELLNVSRLHDADVAFQKDNITRWSRRLIVFNMSGTLIEQDVGDELAKLANVEEENNAITAAEARGAVDFLESMKDRVALLQGWNAAELFDKVRKTITFTPGAKNLCRALKKFGYKTAVVSQGFHPLAREVQRHLGLDYVFANCLEVDKHGYLTGNVAGPIITPQRKRGLLAMIANVEGCEVEQTIAVGYGVKDMPMLEAAGLGIHFCAKPDYDAGSGNQEKDMHIFQKDISAVLFLIGLSEHAAEQYAPGFVHAATKSQVSKLPTKDPLGSAQILHWSSISPRMDTSMPKLSSLPSSSRSRL